MSIRIDWPAQLHTHWTYTQLLDSVSRSFPPRDKFWAHFFFLDSIHRRNVCFEQSGNGPILLAQNKRIQIQSALNGRRCLTWSQLTRQNCPFRMVALQRHALRVSFHTFGSASMWMKQSTGVQTVRGTTPWLPPWIPHFVVHVFVPHNLVECLRQIEWSFVLIKWKKKHTLDSFKCWRKTMLGSLQPNWASSFWYFIFIRTVKWCVSACSIAWTTHTKILWIAFVDDSNAEFAFGGDDCSRKRNH